MKLSKLMLSALVAAAALVACNKIETDNLDDSSLKSVELSLANVEFITKGDGGEAITNGQAVYVKSFQVFFTDGSTLYPAYTADNQVVDAYYSAAADGTFADLGTKKVFHFLPASVDRVIVLGNMPKVDIQSVNTVSGIDALLKVEAQQNQKELALYANSRLTRTGDHVQSVDGHTTLLYSATCNLLPRIARMEIKNVGMTFNATPHRFTEVSIAKMAFVDFYNTCNLLAGTVDPQSVTTIPLTENDIFNYFAGLDLYTQNPWHVDDVTLTCAPGATTNNVATNIAYHFFPHSGMKPTIMVRVNAKATATSDAAPAYVYTNDFKAGDTVLDAYHATDGTKGFCPGYIYRMNYIFDESNLEHQDKCIDVTVTVDTWKVVAVTPVF